MLGAGRSTSTDASAKPKRPRHADGSSGGDADSDRLSALPDELLHEILSRLNALETDGTCVLSARWRHLWRTVPCLDIDAPALVSLCLGTSDIYHISATATEPHTMPSLTDASIRLRAVTGFGLASSAYESGLLATLYNVTSLHLLHLAVKLWRRKDYLKFPIFKNLKTLSLDECYIAGDFLGLEPYLRNSRNLEKHTLRRCKVSDFRTKMKKEEHLHKYSQDPMDFMCENLTISEIIYQDGDAFVDLLVKYLVGMSRNLPNNKIELTKVD